ncbi:hypothetical protein NC661_04880 [Aquibacillus koreensis]|uniref:Uncharacterized protein n=1 Tax=Aquibacillus koreensis TaxID=279446 RepID=A0A9X3WLS5_9BACI|nr:hypothetical protein [Aquibacillus koreensis]MCT2534691.1 hypothetical protein [Aquibacillus koreensis]MDC3419699.1 hypothetical protein [Aquibacillus koreensis]
MLNQQMNTTLHAYIVLPMVLKVFKQDYAFFENEQLIAKIVYLDKLDTVIASVQDDLATVKKTIYNTYHMKVRNLGKQDGFIRYDWQTPDDSGDLLFTPEQLRDLTKDMMRLYLFGFLSRKVTPSNRAWF